MNYYEDVSATLPANKDNYFVDMVIDTWKIPGMFGGPGKMMSSIKKKDEEEQKTDKGLEQRLEKKVEKNTPQDKMKELESILYEKLRQRTKTKEDEGKAMMRAIKYVDVADTGALTLDQFSKVLVNIGCLLTPADVKTLFTRFADQSSGKICAEKMANYFALMGSGNNPNVVPKFKVEAQAPDQILAKIRKTLVEKGANGMRGMGRLLRKVDKSGNKKITRHEFTWAMKENGHNLSNLELERLFKYFDRNNDNVIRYNEFIRAVRGDLSHRRRLAIERTFKMLNTEGTGRIKLEDLVNLYRVESHPKVNWKLMISL